MSTLILKSFAMIGFAAMCAHASQALPPAATPAAVAPANASSVDPPQASAPVSAPFSVTAAQIAAIKISQRPPLLSEGAFLTQVAGSLEASEGDQGWEFRFRDSFDAEPDRVMQLLPSITLADMIRNRAQMKQGSIAKFALTGRVTLYHGANYVMPLFATVISEFPPRQARPILAPPGSWYGSSEALALAESRAGKGQLAATQASMALMRKAFLSLASPLSPQALAAEKSQKQNMIGGISADDIEQELVARVGDIQRSMDAPRLPALNPNSTNEMKWLQPGRRMHDRLGTVMRDPVNGVWRFVFESSRGRVGEREAELLPCTLTESMVKQAQSGGGVSSGILSGEITLFEGRSYMLPTSFGTLRTGKLLSR